MPESACTLLATVIHEESKKVRLDPVLVLAVIEVESSWDAYALSEKGAAGLMQLRQIAFETEARGLIFEGADRFQPIANVRAGIRYLGRLCHAYQDPDLALVAFNAGPTSVNTYLRKEGQIPERFQSYPRRVYRTEEELRRRYVRKEAEGAAGETICATVSAER